MKKKQLFSLALAALLLFFASSCDLLFNPIDPVDEGDDPTVEETDYYVDEILARLAADLTNSSTVASSSSARLVAGADNNLTSAEITAIISAARRKVENEDLLESTDLNAFLPFVIAGAQEQIAQTASAGSTDQKMNIIDTLVDTSISFAETEMDNETGVKTLIVEVTKTVVENIPNTGIGASEIGTVSGSAMSIIVSKTRSVVTVDSLNEVVAAVASTSIEALSVAYSEVLDETTGDQVSEAVSVVTGTILEEVSTFADLSDENMADTLVEVTSGINSSIGVLSSTLDGNMAGGAVDVTGIAESVVANVTEDILGLNTFDNGAVINDIIGNTITMLAANDTHLMELASAVTAVAVQTASESATGAELTDLVEDVVQGVSKAVTSEDANASVTDITTAIQTGLNQTDVDTSGVDVNGTVETAASNNTPVVSIAISNDTFNIDTEVDATATITVTATDADAADVLTYAWSFSDILGESNTAGSTSVEEINVPDSEGVHTVYVTVSDSKEEVTVYVEITVLADTGETDAERAVRLVEDGKILLRNTNFTEALDVFSRAYDADSTNAEAALYWSFLNMGAIVTDPAVQTIASNAGFTHYPTNMEDFITWDWVNTMAVTSVHSMLSWDTETGTDVYIYDPTTVYFPELAIPEGYDEISYFSIPLQSQEYLTTGEYMHALMYNLQNSYPNGFTAPVHEVVGIISDKLDYVTSALNLLSAENSINLTYDMVSDIPYDPFNNIWPPDENNQPMPIVIGKAEVEVSMASIQIINSLLNSILAMDLTVDLATFYSAFNMNDGLFWDTNYLDNANAYDWNNQLESAYNWGVLPEYPLASGFLQSTDNASAVLADSKQYMLDALTNLASAADNLEARSSETSEFTLSAATTGTEIWNTIDDVLGVSSVFIDKMQDSITNGTSFVVPADIFMGNIDGLDVAANWPTTADWSSVIEVTDILNADIEVNFSALYDKPLFTLDNIIDLKDNGEPVIYRENAGTFTPVDTYSVTELDADIAAGVKFAVKIQDVTLNGLVDVPATYVADLIEASNPNTAIKNALTQVESNGAISYYISMIEPSAVFSALHPAGTIAGGANEVKATGSFWYAMVPMVEDLQERILDGNDTVEEAVTISTDGIVYNNSLTYDDEDYFKVSCEAGKYYEVRVDFNDEYNFNVDVSGPSYDWEVFRDWEYRESTYTKIYVAEYSEDHFLRIEDRRNLYEKDYTFSITELVPTDDGNDSIAEAVSLSIDGTSISGDSGMIDKDYYQVDLLGGNIYKFEYTNTDIDAPEYIYSNQFRLYNDTEEYTYGNSRTDNNLKVIYYECFYDQTLYLIAKDNLNGESINYEITASIVVVPDDNNDYSNEAESIVIGGDTLSGDLHIFDYDYFSFTAPVSNTYIVNISSTYAYYSQVQIRDDSYSYSYYESGDWSEGLTLQFSGTEGVTYYISLNGPYSEEITIPYEITLTQY